MKILVVSETFTRGGLETHIKTYFDNLPENVEMVFAFSNYSKQVPLNNAKIYTDFHFSYNNTVKDICEDVDRLVDIIKTEKIDVIHTHPFYSFFAALFASQITKTKLIYTYHGRGSFNFLSTFTLNSLFKYAFEINAVAQLQSVSKIGIESFEKIGYKNNIFLPNPIDTEVFKPVEYVNNKKWAIFSRLDIDKFAEIKAFILNRKEYGIEYIDIYGSGAEVDRLMHLISKHNLEEYVKYKGYCSDVSATIANNYNGVAGIGRLVLEGLSMGLPVFFIGYGKVSGFVNKELYDKIKVENFSNYNINYENFTIPSDSEIKSIQNDVRENFSIKNIIQKYLSAIESAESVYLENIKTLYYKLKEFASNEETSGIYFVNDRKIYNLVRNLIQTYSVDNSLNTMFISADFCYHRYDELCAKEYDTRNLLQTETQQLQVKNQRLVSEIEELKKQILILQEKEQYRFQREQAYFDRRSRKLYIRIGRKIKRIIKGRK